MEKVILSLLFLIIIILCLAHSTPKLAVRSDLLSNGECKAALTAKVEKADWHLTVMGGEVVYVVTPPKKNPQLKIRHDQFEIKQFILYGAHYFSGP